MFDGRKKDMFVSNLGRSDGSPGCSRNVLSRQCLGKCAGRRRTQSVEPRTSSSSCRPGVVLPTESGRSVSAKPTTCLYVPATLC